MANERENQASSVRRLTADSIDFSSEDEREALIRQVLDAGNVIALAEREEMIRMGIIDERGNLLMTDLPEDMREDADTDFGG